jgi:hypothetical protein
MKSNNQRFTAGFIMLFMTRIITIITAGFFILASTLHAQSRTCRIVFPERPQSAPKVAFLFNGKVSQAVTLPSMNLSEVIKLPPGELTIAITANKITDPKNLLPKSPLLKIPENVGEFYIIITPDPENTVIPIKMNLVDTGAGKLKPGETLWYNLTDHRIAAKLGSAQMTVDPKGRTISKDPISPSGYYTAQFIYQANGKGEYAPITEQAWWHDTASKHLGFMVNTGGKLPRIYYFRDFRSPDEEESTEDVKPEETE